jgi:hypothetical protein
VALRGGDAAGALLHGGAGVDAPRHADAPLHDGDALHVGVGALLGVGADAEVHGDGGHGYHATTAMNDNNLRSTLLLAAQ